MTCSLVHLRCQRTYGERWSQQLAPEYRQFDVPGIGLRKGCVHERQGGDEKGSQNLREPLLSMNRGDRARTCDLVLPKPASTPRVVLDLPSEQAS
jgi:hypothetical protein